MLEKLLTLETELPEGRTLQLTEDNSLWFALGLLLALASVILGIVLIVGKAELLGRSRFLIGRNGKMDGPAMAVARLTGIQMVIIGVMLAVCILMILNDALLPALVVALIAVILPFPFSSYRKRGKRFQADYYKDKEPKKGA